MYAIFCRSITWKLKYLTVNWKLCKKILESSDLQQLNQCKESIGEKSCWKRKAVWWEKRREWAQCDQHRQWRVWDDSFMAHQSVAAMLKLVNGPFKSRLTHFNWESIPSDMPLSGLIHGKLIEVITGVGAGLYLPDCETLLLLLTMCSHFRQQQVRHLLHLSLYADFNIHIHQSRRVESKWATHRLVCPGMVPFQLISWGS